MSDLINIDDSENNKNNGDLENLETSETLDSSETANSTADITGYEDSKHIQVKLEKFEGPFDLLFHLIRKNKIDIYDIPINLLTEQYLESIKDGEIIDIDNMSEFVLMATTLLEIKSRLLIPKKKVEDEEEVDPREELANKILEYQFFKAISEAMSEQFKNPIITKDKDMEFFNNVDFETFVIPETSELLEGVTLEKLYDMFKEVVLRQENKVDKVRATYGKIQKESFTIESKKDYIRDILRLGKRVVFFDIFSEDSSKTEKITTFLAILELIKLKEVYVEQENNFADIIIKSKLQDENSDVSAEVLDEDLDEEVEY